MAESLRRLHTIVDQIDDYNLLHIIIRLLTAEKDPNDILMLLEYRPSHGFAESEVSISAGMSSESVADTVKYLKPDNTSFSEKVITHAADDADISDTDVIKSEVSKTSDEDIDKQSLPTEKTAVPDTVIPEPTVAKMPSPHAAVDDSPFHGLNFARFEQNSNSRMTPDFSALEKAISSAEPRIIPSFPKDVEAIQTSEFQPLFNLVLDPSFAIKDQALFAAVEKAVAVCQQADKKLNADNAEVIYKKMLEIEELCQTSNNLSEQKQLLVENAVDKTMKAVAPYIPNDRLSAIVK